ncbi:MAG: xylosidase, partial [Mucilaginibacter sp.]|nr:xylosidase [Mucilaginibacter sp.]
VTDNPPVSTNPNTAFANLEGKPSDYYLWLTGEAGKMLKHEEPLNFKLPARPEK